MLGEDYIDPQDYIESGKLDAADKPTFRTHQDALKCFGYTGGLYMQAVWRVPDGKDRIVWFPNFVEADGWYNLISDDGLIIAEISKAGVADPEKGSGRLVFANRVVAPGRRAYVFLGYFELETENEIRPGTKIFRRKESVVDLPKATKP